MENYGCFNFYNQFEYEPYQQPYNNNFQQDQTLSSQVQTLSNQVSQLTSQNQELKDTLNQFMQLTMTNQQNTTASFKNLETQMRQQAQHMSQMSQILANQQGGTFTANTQNNPNNIKPEHCKATLTRSGKVIGEGVNDNLTVERKIVENEGNEEEDVYGRSDTEEAETVENDEAMKMEWLLIKEESMEERGKKLNKVEIDRVIDEICSLFNKPKLGRIWTPHQLYLKFMEFLPKRRSTKDDVLSVSFWPP